ncbi:MAG TPA: C25 family cysteine peptidase [Blastocatellia bacterium]|nr:C25 family cysteine peptidase [Blastocatellia bacterium]
MKISLPGRGRRTGVSRKAGLHTQASRSLSRRQWLIPSVATVALVAMLSIAIVQAAISLSTSTPYTQNFDSMGTSATATLPTDWKVDKQSVVRTVGTYAAAVTATSLAGGANLSSSAANGIYNFGSGTTTTGADRAVGFLSSSSGTQSGNLYAQFVNNTGGNLSGLQISYDVEKYRNGTNASGFSIQLYYSTDGSAWTSAGANFLTSFAGANADSNGFATAPGATSSVSNQTLTVTIANGGNFYLAWNYSVTSGSTTSSAQALAVDNVSVLGIGGGGSTNPAGVGAASPSSVVRGNTTLLTVTVTPGSGPASTGLAVTADLTSIGGSATQAFLDDGMNGDASAGDNIFSYNASVPVGTSVGMKSLPFTVSDAQMRTGTGSISLTVTAPGGSIRIHDIQGAGHTSPLVGTAVSGVPGIVTALVSNGFYLQDPTPDADDATSEGIFVFTSSAPTVSVGHSVTVSGNVQEFRPGGASSTSLTITEIASPTIAIVSTGNPLPTATVIGTGGRVPPTTVIEDDASGGSVENAGSIFDPASDGIDFYESLEGMRVQINDAVAVSHTVDFTSNRELAVLGDNGTNAGIRTARGGIVIRSTDYNPERVILNDLITGGPTLPAANVSDTFPGPIVGVMDYTFNNYKLQVQTLPAMVSGGLALETATPAGTDQIAIATFNCENLDPTDGTARFDALADVIVNRLKSPDLVTLEEIQDNNGATSDGTVSASTTMGMMISAIQSAGGPTYQYRQINPVNNADGGEPGGNIRQVFMFRTDRGLSFIDRAGGTSTAATTVVSGANGPELSFSPGRVDPTNSAWNSSRKPLAGEFMYNGTHFFVIGNHFNSKGGDQPLFGRFQPPTLSSETQRLQQAQIVHDFVNSILTLDANASVVVLGDLNDFEFSNPLVTLKGSILHALIESLPQNERYSYNFDGNAQTLDHILISNRLFNSVPFVFDVVHVNSEFAVQTSDHDPSVVRLTLSPTAARLDDFSATVEGNEVLLRWQTGEETDNLGFNLYREVSGQRRRITPQLVAGSALVAGPGTRLGAGRSYSWWDTSQGGAGARYWLEEIDLKGESRWHGPVTVKASGSGKRSVTRERQAMTLSMLGREQIQEGVTRPVEATADEVQLAAKSPAGVNLGNQPAVKIAINHEGWYRVTQPELVRAGLSPKADSRLLQLYVDGREQPMLVSSKNGTRFTGTDAIEFYGMGLDTAASNTRIYWLTVGSQPGQRIQQQKGAGVADTPTSFAYTVERKDRTIYFSSLRNGERENFFGAIVSHIPVDQAITLQHMAAKAASETTLEIALQGVTDLPHRVQILLNGVAVGEATFDGQSATTVRMPLAAGLLKEGANVVNLTAHGDPSDLSLVDYIRVTYPHTYTADNNSLRLTVAGNQPLMIDGFSSSAIRVFDVTSIAAPQEIIGTTRATQAGYGVWAMATGSGPRRLLVMTDDQAQRAAAITANLPSSWRQRDQAADMVIITHGSLIGSAATLKAYRESQGLRVAVVDVEDLFDEFSYGNKSADAIRDFLGYAATKWQRAPRFVLLLGDASYDPKNYLGRGEFDLVPTKLIDTQFMETASDDWLADFNGAGKAEMAVGRLPVRGADEAARMIEKIISYEGAAAVGGALIVSDSSDSFAFDRAGDQLRALIPATVAVEQIDRGQMGTAQAKRALLDSLGRGQRVVNYQGHGSVDLWRDSLFTAADARGLTNGGRLPLFVAMTCLNGYFQDTATDSLAESLLKAERGGAIAVWASSGITQPAGQSQMNQQLYRLLFDENGGRGTLGELTLKAKAKISDPDIRRTWILFGDPATAWR